MSNETKVKVIAMKISFLMHHQTILPDLKQLATELYPLGVDPDKINKDSPEYLMGAYEALAGLIASLEQKGPHIK